MKKPKPRPGTPDGARPLKGYPRTSFWAGIPHLVQDVTCLFCGEPSGIPEWVQEKA